MIPLRSMLLRTLGVALVLIVSLQLGGCASVKVLPESNVAPSVSSVRPSRLIVGEFDFSDATLSGRARGSRAAARIRGELPLALRKELVKALRPLGFEIMPAVPDRLDTRTAAWLISGKFTRVERGSRFLRLAIGFGSGASKVETTVRIEDLKSRSRKTVASFRTTSFSGGDPGLITSIGGSPLDAVGAAVTLATTTGNGPTDDTRRTARMIAAYVSELLAERGWIDPTLVRRAKK